MKVRLSYPGKPRETIDAGLRVIRGYLAHGANKSHRYHYLEIVTLENLKRVLACLPSDGEVTIEY